MADIRGNDGNNRLRGTNTADRVRGDDGNDTLLGRGGNDVLEGDDGSDRLSGDAGADTLEGDKGNDILTGGADADVFLFGDNDGRDRITDFEDGIDRIRISAPGIADLGDLTIRENGRGDAVIRFVSDGDTTEITLLGVAAAALGESDFIFGAG
jgi:Ca2+-binding RTX toxin-like protein